MHPGDIVAGKFRIQNILGRQRGLLLEARHTEFDQRVVIRLLSPALCNDKEIEQFRREAKTLSKLESEHVARIIDVGTHSDGSFFLVRQYLDGADLGTHIRTHGALRLEEAVLYALQTMEAVQECHHHNILLRELQPSHLFLTSKRGGTPLVKITDFGTAKLLKDPAGAVVNGEMTATVMFGMSNYSSPELVRKSGGIDARTDVWSLGCILYEMLAAVPPFQGEMAELMLKITREEPIPLSSLRPDLPREFDQIISWALAKDAGSRFSSVYAFAHALKPYSSAAGQVLIDQIGRLAHAQKDTGGGAAISPTSPLAKRSQPRYEADEATVLHQVPGYTAPGSGSVPPPASDENEFERTAFLDPNAINDSRGSVPPPAASRGSVPPPPGSYGGDRGSVPPPRARQGSWIEPDPAAGGLSANATGGYPASTATGHHKRARQRKMAVWAIGAALVLVPVLVVIVVFALRGDGAVAEADIDPDAPVSVEDKGAGTDPGTEPGAGDGGSAASPDTTAEPDGTSEPDNLDEPEDDGGKPATPEPKSTTAPPPPPVGGGQFTAPPPPPPPKPEPTASTKKKKKSSKKKKKKKSSSSSTGTLVAIAIGGSCSFAVDGSPRGTKSSIRVTVPLGPHTVSCTPPGKASRSQTVVVKGDKPGIASFKVN